MFGMMSYLLNLFGIGDPSLDHGVGSPGYGG